MSCGWLLQVSDPGARQDRAALTCEWWSPDTGAVPSISARVDCGDKVWQNNLREGEF